MSSINTTNSDVPDISSSIIINSSMEKVHSIFLKFENYPQWSSFIKSISSNDGNFNKGSQLEIELVFKESEKPTIMTPIVTENSKNQFSWLGTLGSSWIFEGEHKFEFESLENDKTKVIQSEKFNGILKKPVLWFVMKDTLNGFKNFNEYLKVKCESSANSTMK